ncbi:LysR substrate-binding domain-containing protein [Alcaligenes endophyticus]|uniref:LysR family transcriptional regulator n=1 Tax=Alcaligenes endophyticus TaxID=1929088 RepID=A0ABT8EJN0_9BURK|nr:LysR substrate-binding domain-containing protein [Alcaligenes endophyticus]MCX5591758.1 LysR substrate-binding domain-containing protein [Alcaligenes endophyticus]MDN4121435.1 LysR family transcriptional regulator [Alcaligenes endophyticus]
MLIDPRLAHMFCVLAEELHFGRAAKRLFISQPPLSQAIRQLEEELGAELFIRTTRSVSLSRAGQALYPELRDLEAKTMQLRQKIRALGEGKQGVVNMGITPSGMYSNFSGLLRHLRHHFPAVEFNIVESSTHLIHEQIRNGSLDIGLIRLLSPIPDLASCLLYREPLCIAVPADHPFAQRHSLSPHELNQADMIMYDPRLSPYFFNLVNRCLAQHQISVNPVQQGMLPTILSLVEGGIGVALVPSVFSRYRLMHLHYLPLEGPQEHLAELSMAWRQDESDHLLKQVIATLGQYPYADGLSAA